LAYAAIDMHCRQEIRDSVGAFGADGAYPAFGVGVHPRELGRRAQHLDAFGGEYGVERVGELSGPIPDQVPDGVRPGCRLPGELPGGLYGPLTGWVRRGAEDVHKAIANIYGEEDARVMRKFSIAGIRLRKKVRTTVPEPSATPVADLFGRDFTAPTPGLKYMGDITYLVRRVALCCIPRAAGRDLEGYS
jgi:hypothetical protein